VTVQPIDYITFQRATLEYGRVDNHSGSTFFGALLDNGAVCGAVKLRKTGQSSVSVEALYVQPAMRKQGVGLALLQAVMQHAHDEGWVKKVRASALYSSLNLFLRIGFTKRIQRKHGWWVERRL
jgi:GNAT superfamily N-acetyltransferase